MKRLIGFIGLALAATLAIASPAAASTILFNNAAADLGGTLTFSTSGPGTLTNGAIDGVTRISPSIGPSFTITGLCGTLSGGCINVSTGAYLPGSSNPGTGLFVYAPGTLAITGTTVGVPGATGSLYSGNFASNIAIQVTGTTGTLQGTLDGGTLNAALAGALFSNPTTTGGSGNDLFINFAANANATGGSGGVTQNQYQVITAEVPVPEPASLALVGSGLLGLYGSVRRRVSKRKTNA